MEHVTLSKYQEEALFDIIVCVNKNIHLIGGVRIGKSFLKRYILDYLKLDCNIKTSIKDEHIEGYTNVYLKSTFDNVPKEHLEFVKNLPDCKQRSFL